MPTRRSAAPQPDAVTRRLSLLSAELAAVRETPTADTDPALHTRVRALSVVPHGPVEVPAEAPALPSPGRHASRPTSASRARDLAGLMPDTLRGRVRLSGTQLALVALAVAAGLALAVWWTLRSGSSGEPVPAASPLAGAAVPGLQTPGPSAREGAPSSAPTSAGTVVVDVAGAVRRPGIVVLASGSRVVDAVEAAGGARRRVDLSGLNQARLLVDGEQIVVGGPGVPGLPGVAASAAPSVTAPTLVNINTATSAQLEQLPGVGPVTAQAIIDWRTTNGGFTSVEELLEVDGIGDATLADLAPYVTI